MIKTEISRDGTKNGCAVPRWVRVMAHAHTVRVGSVLGPREASQEVPRRVQTIENWLTLESDPRRAVDGHFTRRVARRSRWFRQADRCGSSRRLSVRVWVKS